MSAYDFLSTILPHPLDKGRMSIFLLPSSKNAWFDNAQEAADYVQKHDGKQNCYFSLASYGKVVSGRGKEEDTVSLLAVGIDLDIASAVHSKDNLPKSQEEALSYVDLAFPGIRPTIITNSGHGLQCFYVFKEPWIFENENDKVAAKQLCADIRHNYQYHLAKQGYTMDATYDLARIMRVAGTLNIKSEPVRSVIVERSGNYFSPDDFEQLIIAERRRTIDTIVRSGEGSAYDLILDSNAIPPKAKFVGLKENSDFLLVWEKELDGKLKARLKANGDEGDASLSIYDMMLANKAVRDGWTPQETADLIIAFRRKHAKGPKEFHKALRPDYMERTIKKAFESYEKILDPTHIKDVALELKMIDARKKAGEKVPQAEQDEAEDKARSVVTSFFGGRKFKKLKKYLSDPPEYEVVFENGEKINLGAGKDLMCQRSLRNRVFDKYGKVPESLGKTSFEKMLNFLGRRIENVHTSPETREVDRMKNWIQEYLSGISIETDRHAAFINGQDPFLDNKRMFLFGHKLRTFIHASYGEKLSSKQFGLTMKRLGCNNQSMNFIKVDGKKTSAVVYEITGVADDHKGLVN